MYGFLAQSFGRAASKDWSSPYNTLWPGIGGYGSTTCSMMLTCRPGSTLSSTEEMHRHVFPSTPIYFARSIRLLIQRMILIQLLLPVLFLQASKMDPVLQVLFSLRAHNFHQSVGLPVLLFVFHLRCLRNRQPATISLTFWKRLSSSGCTPQNPISWLDNGNHKLAPASFSFG